MEEAPQVPGLTRTQFAITLAVCLSIFLLAGGPIWQQPWKMDQVDLAILWSYAPLPLLVLGFLAWSRRLRVASFLLETLRLVLVKYSITFALALVLWTMTDQPAHAAPTPLRSGRAGSSAALPPYQGPTGTLRGRVLDATATGTAVSGALVFVDTDLAGEPNAAPLQLTNEGRGLSPRLAVAQTGQAIALRSGDGRLHTAAAETEGSPLFNVPAIRSGSWSRTSIDEPHDAVTVRCTVHPGEEAPAHLTVLRHGWHALTAADGTFAIEGVPRGERRVVARRLDGDAMVEIAATVEVTATGDVELTFAPR